MQNLDVEILDENEVLSLLNLLPDSYKNLTTILLYEKSKISFEDVFVLMNNEYRKLYNKFHQNWNLDTLVV